MTMLPRTTIFPSRCLCWSHVARWP